jgi:adenine-specific DNA-methyltransferase
MPKNPKSPIPVLATKHKDKRTNIPTKELRGFVADDEARPKTILYPRDPSLDPQLVWRGKDEQDREPLAVPAVPIYIQEKIHPQAIIENVRAESKKDEPQQTGLFADFNGIKFEELIDFYHHEQNWSNRFILGDSLLVMTSLAEKEGLKGKVQCLYFDPPYGINFGSNWQVSTRKRDVKDGKAEDATRQPEQIRAFRDTWKLGIHSYLAYLRDRLTAARELLTESGSVFVQIGDENVHLVRAVMDEVFGSENFVSLISFRTTSSLGGELLGKSCDYIVWYAKQREHLKFRQIYKSRGYEDDIGGRYTRVQLADGTRRVMTTEEREDISRLPSGARIYRHDNLTSQSGTEKSAYPVKFQGNTFTPGNGYWKTNEKGMAVLAAAGRLAAPTVNSLGYVRFIDDFPVSTFSNVWTDTQTGAFTEDKVYVVQTNTKVIERCILMTTDPGDLVLDPTCGSGTTAYVAEQWGRRWITIDTSRVAVALARTRLMAAKFPYYLLADSPEGIRKEMELSGKIVAASRQSAADSVENNLRRSADAPLREADIKRGFISKRVPHVTLKSIANNPDIKPGMSRAEIDAAIAKHADTELLYDQPYEDNKRIRVTGPFTVESLSPHRVLDTDEELPASETEGKKQSATGQFETLIIENLKSAGVQNTRKGERLKFDSLETFAGTWIHAVGSYSEAPHPGPLPAGDGESQSAQKRKDGGRPKDDQMAKDGTKAVPSPGGEGQGEGGRSPKTKRVAISIGPEHGTVSPEQVQEAAKEAVQGVGFDLLIVCGFAFDPHVTEEAKRYGKLQVVIARMNPDLAMGDELLKKTGAGNLFMVFGELDMEVNRVSEGRVTRVPNQKPGEKDGTRGTRPSEELLTVTIKGVDVYDPTTGQIRNSSTDDIACWFVDTDYNGESFFVRQAYFTGADEPYEKLKRALRSEIDEAAWQTLYSTTSRPFPSPKNKKIAVKVINHYGDEVLKVVEVK